MGNLTISNAQGQRGAVSVEQRNYAVVKTLCKQTEAQFARMLGSPEKASQFGASVISAVSTNNALQQCMPNEVMQQALIAASLNLDVNPNLGLSAIIPYKTQGRMAPQFQIMARGYIQLAMRSGEYKALDSVEVYEDEFISFDPFLNQLNYRLVPDGQRARGETNKIVGYYAYYELRNGARHCLFWTISQVRAHGEKYSKSYRYSGSPWQTNFDAMAKKTLIKALISKWGMMSTIMQRAVLVDQSTGVTTDDKGAILSVDYSDNLSDGQSVQTEAEAPAVNAQASAQDAAGQAQSESQESVTQFSDSEEF